MTAVRLDELKKGTETRGMLIPKNFFQFNKSLWVDQLAVENNDQSSTGSIHCSSNSNINQLVGIDSD